MLQEFAAKFRRPRVAIMPDGSVGSKIVTTVATINAENMNQASLYCTFEYPGADVLEVMEKEKAERLGWYDVRIPDSPI